MARPRDRSSTRSGRTARTRRTRSSRDGQAGARVSATDRSSGLHVRCRRAARTARRVRVPVRFDFDSVFERKNPLAVDRGVRGVRSGPRRRPTGDQDRRAAKRIRKSSGGSAAAASARARTSTSTTATSKREEHAALVAACDAYVSLHRAEGFGLHDGRSDGTRQAGDRDRVLGQPRVHGRRPTAGSSTTRSCRSRTGNDPYPADGAVGGTGPRCTRRRRCARSSTTRQLAADARGAGGGRHRAACTSPAARGRSSSSDARGGRSPRRCVEPRRRRVARWRPVRAAREVGSTGRSASYYPTSGPDLAIARRVHGATRAATATPCGRCGRSGTSSNTRIASTRRRRRLRTLRASSRADRRCAMKQLEHELRAVSARA